MLRITALHLEDFGPFKGKQTIAFSSADGVTIVYGENMRGKTSLLNAIRFALFGKVLGRGAHSLPLHKVGNWEQAARGKYGFSVQLEFKNENHRYKLTRSSQLRAGVKTPHDDDDYTHGDYFLERDSAVLGPQQARAELERILPEQISRFFLFDGELLQEYEDLLSSDSDMGRQISDAIERILGVPVLTRARATLLTLKGQSERREATAAQGDQKTQEFGNHLAALHEEREVVKSDLARLEGELQKMRTQKALLEEAMRKKERVAALFDKQVALERESNDLEARLQSKQVELEQAMANAWCVPLSEPLRDALQRLRATERTLDSALMRTQVLSSLHVDTTAECPACLQVIAPEARARIEASLSAERGSHRQEKDRELSAIRRRLDALERFAALARQDVVRFRWDAVEEVKVDHAAKCGELEEITKQLEGIDEEGLRKIKVEFESAVRQMAALEKGIQESRDRLGRITADAQEIQKRLERLAGQDLGAERQRRQLFSDLHELFDGAVAVYREHLRQRVETDATRHFKDLTTEPDYAGLRINKSYGLTIVHKDGSDIQVRSAGAEHVVALSLVGALQNNAPLRGPIVIDSPFGRLDRGHTRNIIRALPGMARQVLLLVYEEELPPDVARSELKSKLRGEWRLERRSAKHTALVERTG